MNWKSKRRRHRSRVYSGIDATNTTTAVASATQRARPDAAIAEQQHEQAARDRAARSGTKEVGNPACVSLFLDLFVSSGARQEPAEHDGEADDHPERIGIQKAALAPGARRRPAKLDEPGRSRR